MTKRQNETSKRGTLEEHPLPAEPMGDQPLIRFLQSLGLAHLHLEREHDSGRDPQP